MQPRRYLSILSFVAIPLALCAFASTAHAQFQGNGIKLGDSLLLHVGTGIEVGWDSNVFYQSTNEINAFELRLTPRFDLSNRTRQATRQLDFDLHAGLNYLEYLTSQQFSRLRQFGVDAGAQLAVLPEGRYNVVFFDNFVRSVQAPYDPASSNLDRDTNELGFRVSLSPGGGRLTFNVGYLFGIDYFEEGQLQPFDLMYHRFDLRASWKFLPKTAVYVAATEILYLYQSPDPTDPHPNSYPLRVDAGLQGLLTAKLSFNLWIGYGNGFYQYNGAQIAAGNNPNPNTVVGGLALTWKPTALSAGALGYSHDFVNSLLGSYYDLDQVYASWTQLIWRFTGFIRFAYANERFQGITAISAMPADQKSRTDNYITLNTRLDYPFKNWLWASLGYDLQYNKSNGQLVLGPGNFNLVPINYTKNTVYLRLTLWY